MSAPAKASTPARASAPARASTKAPERAYRSNAWTCFTVGLVVCAALLAAVYAVEVM